jgi:uncharacterized protein (DUF983 family)
MICEEAQKKADLLNIEYQEKQAKKNEYSEECLFFNKYKLCPHCASSAVIDRWFIGGYKCKSCGFKTNRYD